MEPSKRGGNRSREKEKNPADVDVYPKGKRRTRRSMLKKGEKRPPAGEGKKKYS